VVARPFQLLAPETALARNTLLRRPNRTALSLAGLLVSSALVVSVAGLSQGALSAGETWVDSLFVSDHLVVSPVHQSEAIRKEFSSLDGVAGTSPINFFTLRTPDRAVNMAAIAPLDYASRSKLQFVSGQRQTAFSQLEESRGLFISRRFAGTRHVGLGDSLLIGGAGPIVPYRVAAVVAHTLPSPGGEETVLISLLNARQDFNVEGFNVLQVIPTSNAGSGFESSLAGQAQRYGLQMESVADVRAGVRRGLNSLLFLLTGVGLAGVVLGLMSVVTTILINVSESTREFGLLRAVGLTRAQLRGLILAQSSILGLSGALLGVLVGLGLAEVMARAGSSIGFQPSYSVPWEVIVAVLLAAVVGSMVAVLAPARRASAQSVVAAVRYE
jgi:putative ABC transport system permease protein